MGMLVTGCFFAGVAVGMLASTIPMYASELSTPKWRGALSGLLQWFLSWGLLIAQWLVYGCSFSSTAFSCRFFLGFQIFPAPILIQTSLMIIEISGALSIVYCTSGLWLLDKFGRVKPLIASAAGLDPALLVNAV
ncbi:putative General substrate transporter [Seiridium cardinale]